MEQDYVIKLCDDLYSAVNNNPIPISAKYFIVKDFFDEMQIIYDRYCQQQIQQSKSQEQEEEKKEESKTVEVTVPVEYTQEEIEAMKQ